MQKPDPSGQRQPDLSLPTPALCPLCRLRTSCPSYSPTGPSMYAAFACMGLLAARVFS